MYNREKMKTRFYITSGFAFFMCVLITSLELYYSWSQTAGNNEDPYLYATLFPIALCFWQAGDGHSFRNRKILGGIKFRHFMYATAIFFGGVIAFSVNNHSLVIWGLTVSDLHLVFTGLAIVTPYVGVLLANKAGQELKAAILSAVVGLGLFALGYIFNFYSTSVGELNAATPLVVSLVFTYSKKY